MSISMEVIKYIANSENFVVKIDKYKILELYNIHRSIIAFSKKADS